ncbi:MAG: VCBS repeat-containing protein [Labilithrix sp.]|nr:VCBS repeat-containing protein [Labilithrix sp.]
MSVPARATALTSGDFDGDGVTDVAFSTVVDGKPAVCAYSANSDSMTMRSCWGPDAWWGEGKPAPDAAAVEGFGVSLAAGDLDGDGKDEILVASASGIVVLTHHGAGFTSDSTSFTATAIPGSFGSRVAMIHPGRPTKAKWAVYGADAKSINIFTGTEMTQKIDVSKDETIMSVGVSIR